MAFDQHGAFILDQNGKKVLDLPRAKSVTGKAGVQTERALVCLGGALAVVGWTFAVRRLAAELPADGRRCSS